MARPEVKVRITAQNDTAAGIGGVSRALTSLKGDLQGMVAGYFSFQTVKSVFTGILNATIEGEQATAKLNAVLRATGNTAGMTATQITELSDALSQQSLFDDEAIRDASAVLATFRNVAGQSFKDAMTAAVDLSTVMGQDLQSSVVQIGKALNDPIKGMTALQKIGVSFNATQRTMIKDFMESGRIMDAQKVILRELSAEFGGAGAASSQGLAGSVHQAKMAWDELLESIGKTEGFKSVVSSTIDGWASVLDIIRRNIEKNSVPMQRVGQQMADTRRELQRLDAWLESTKNKPNNLLWFKGDWQPRDKVQEFANALRAELPKLESQAKTAVAAAHSAITTPPPTNTRPEEQLRAVQRAIQALKDEGAAIGASAAELQAYKLALMGATKEEIKFAEELRLKNYAFKALEDAGTRVADRPQITQKPYPSIKGEMQAPNAKSSSKADATKYVSEATQDFLDAMATAKGQVANSIASTLGDGIANGFASALSKGGIVEGFKAFSETLLAGLGNAMVEFGKAALLASTLMEKIKSSLASFSPAGAVAASIAMIAVGGMLSGAASSAFGGGSIGSGYSSRGITDNVTRVVFTPSTNAAAASKVEPKQVTHNWMVIGKHDPLIQRDIMDIVNAAEDRGLGRPSGR